MTKAFYQNITSLLTAIDDCLKAKQILPALILIYVGIDVVASLDRHPAEWTKAAFIRWSNQYLLQVKGLPCTALELYAGRCAVVHSLAAESDLSRGGEARPLIYAWGNASAEDLQKASNACNESPHAAIHVSDLLEGFRTGLVSYLDELEQDPDREARARENAGIWMTSISKELVAAFLSAYVEPDP